MADLETLESCTIDDFSQLLKEYGLPKNTPQDLVVNLLESLEKQKIDPSDVNAVEGVLSSSVLWAWAQGEQVELHEELPVEEFAQRMAALFGI